MNKLLGSIEEAVRACGLRDGMTISFHHHLRGGDYVLNLVMEAIAAQGIHDLTINASAIQDGHGPLGAHIRNKVVTGIEANFIGPVIGRVISEGHLEHPVIFRTHGGRASDIDDGTSHIDVAFIAAPSADERGNCNGILGPSACGSLGYAMPDARHADKVVVITDNLMPYPLSPISISEADVDYVVRVDKIGDPAGIATGSTKLTRDPVALRIASQASRVIEASGLLRDGFSFQTGAGGASLAVAGMLTETMVAGKIHGSYALGGTTGYLVDMLEAGCFEKLLDVQCFDLKAIASLRENPRHVEISASQYAGPKSKSCAADGLDVVLLGATQIDTDFNVNVHTDSNGRIIGGSGGHSDVAACAKLTIIVAPLSRARLPIVVDHVLTTSTPGDTVDVLVTQAGVAVNPKRGDLIERLRAAKLPLVSIESLRELAERQCGVPRPAALSDRVVGRVLYRDGKVIDTIYGVQ